MLIWKVDIILITVQDDNNILFVNPDHCFKLKWYLLSLFNVIVFQDNMLKPLSFKLIFKKYLNIKACDIKLFN